VTISKNWIQFHESIDLQTHIKVMGVGGGGCNAVDRMIASGFDGVEYISVNTDLQALLQNKSLEKVQLGPKRTRGLGAGGDPLIGKESAQESTEEIKEVLSDCDLLFLLAGFGGGTGTGAVPIIAKVAQELNILTVPVITKPFAFEGRKRSQFAENGIAQLMDKGTSIIIVPNEKLLSLVSEDTSVLDAFLVTDKYLMNCVESLYRLLSMPGLINVDFADVRTVMSQQGLAVLGQGTGEGNQKVSEAVEHALSSPLLEQNSLTGAKGLLLHVHGGNDVTLIEVNKALTKIEAMVDGDAQIIFGATLDEKTENKAHVTIIATGISQEVKKTPVVEPKILEPKILEPKPQVETRDPRIVEPNLQVEQKEKPKPPLPEKKIPKKTSPVVSKEKQIVLNFTPGQKGRFEKTEPTLHDGEDLDIPTFIRRKKLFTEVTEEDV